jgi:hypothetical protein
MHFILSFAIGMLSIAAPLPVKSDNEGKIVGKWESLPGGVLPDGAAITIEFTKERKFTMSVSAQGMIVKTITGTYTLGARSAVTIDNLSEAVDGRTRHKEKVVIADGKLTMTDSDGKFLVFKPAQQ